MLAESDQEIEQEHNSKLEFHYAEWGAGVGVWGPRVAKLWHYYAKVWKVVRLELVRQLSVVGSQVRSYSAKSLESGTVHTAKAFGAPLARCVLQKLIANSPWDERGWDRPENRADNGIVSTVKHAIELSMRLADPPAAGPRAHVKAATLYAQRFLNFGTPEASYIVMVEPFMGVRLLNMRTNFDNRIWRFSKSVEICDKFIGVPVSSDFGGHALEIGRKKREAEKKAQAEAAETTGAVAASNNATATGSEVALDKHAEWSETVSIASLAESGVVDTDGHCVLPSKRRFRRKTTPPWDVETLEKIAAEDAAAGPEDHMIDLVDLDVQGSELYSLMANKENFINIFRRRVRRIHVGTHNRGDHYKLKQLFLETGDFLIEADFVTASLQATDFGKVGFRDGVLDVVNKKFVGENFFGL